MQLEGGLANLGRSRPCKGAAFRLQMWRVGEEKAMGNIFCLHCQHLHLDRRKACVLPSLNPGGRLCHGSTHVNSTHSPSMSLIHGLDTSAVHFL